MRSWRTIVPIALILVYFLLLTHRGVNEDFNNDDMMNLCVAYLKSPGTYVKGTIAFWTGVIRPLGALFYLTVYQYAGFWSMPFRVACFAFLLLNLVLLYRFVLLLTRSRRFATLALLFGCFHASMSDIFMSTGTVYDILCQCFLLMGLNLYVTGRDWNQRIPFWRLLLITLCAVAAVDAKEMGVSFPALLLAYEWVFHAREMRKWRTWFPHYGITILLTGLVSLVFLWSRLVRPNELQQMAAYQPVFSTERFLSTNTNYINQILFHGKLMQWSALGVLFLPLVLALLLRSQLMLFGWLYYVLALAPMLFVPGRSGYALYIPYTGFAILVTAFVLELQDRLPVPVLIRIAAVLGFAAWVLQFQWHQNKVSQRLGDHPSGISEVQQVARSVSSRYPSLPKGSRLLLINDPFGSEQYLPYFTLALRYGDPKLTVEKWKWNQNNRTVQVPLSSYDHVFLYGNHSFWELTQSSNALRAGMISGRFPSSIQMQDPLAEFSLVNDVGGLDPSTNLRWANQDPQLCFRIPHQPAQFFMEYEVPQVILEQTGPLRIEGKIGNVPLIPLTIRKAGKLRLEAPVPPHLKQDDIVTVQFHIANPYISASDGARLSFLLRSAGLISQNE